MADIYSRAARVLIWLGPEAQNSSRALSCLEYIASKVKYDWNTQELSVATEELHWADRTIVPPLAAEDWIAIYQLINRPWFERLWIRQEVHLASGDPALMCGYHTIPWSSVCHAVACIWHKPTGNPGKDYIELFQARLRLVFKLCDGRSELDLQYLIADTQHSVCSDPRDKIYSLLSIASTQEVCEIEPDYTKSVHDVYRDAVLSTIRTTKFFNLDILTAVEADEDEAKVPSWVPDLSSPRKARPLSLGLASSNTINTLPLETNPITLTVQGLLIGVVEKVHVIPAFGSRSTISAIQDLKRIATSALFFPLQEHQLKAFCRTITGNDVRERCSPVLDALPSLIQLEILMKDLLEASPVYEGTIMRKISSSLRIINSYCSGRTFFSSHEGRFGLGPYNARPGDLVAVLLGCRMPMMLRTCSEGGYQVIGEAYYDGFMNGEALLGPLPEPHVARHRYDGARLWYWNYLNQETGHFQVEDPRLGPLPPGWSLRSHSEEDFGQWIVNDETGEDACPDPRLTSEALRERGVPLQKLVLV